MGKFKVCFASAGFLRPLRQVITICDCWCSELCAIHMTVLMGTFVWLSHRHESWLYIYISLWGQFLDVWLHLFHKHKIEAILKTTFILCRFIKNKWSFHKKVFYFVEKQASSKLMEASLKILDLKECQSLASDVIIKSEFCAAKENKEIIKGPTNLKSVWIIERFLITIHKTIGFNKF